MRYIDAKHSDGSAANCSAADQEWTGPAEMPMPFLAPWIEEPRSLPRLGIDASKVWTFMVVVGEAGERKVAGNCLASMLFGDDMIDFKGEFVAGLWHAAVLTTVLSAFADQLSKGRVHGRSSTAAGTLEHLPSFGFECGKNRANTFKIVHLRVFFRRERSGTSFGR